MVNAVGNGDTTFCRLFGSNGDALADLLVTTKGGGGAIELNTCGIRRGGPLTLYKGLNIFGPPQRSEDDED